MSRIGYTFTDQHFFWLEILPIQLDILSFFMDIALQAENSIKNDNKVNPIRSQSLGVYS